jgi:tetratricopeptide (TPR) repeat protein
VIANLSKTKAAFQESVELLLRLHQLTLAGKDESKEADDIRDEMAVPWHAMSEAERRTVRELSADLYTIADPPKGTEAHEWSEFRVQINEALDQERYAEALSLLRRNPAHLDFSAGAFLRGICWSGMGLDSAAAEFFLDAERRQPGMPEARLCALSTLITGSREQEALGLAQRWALESDDPSLVLKASEVVFLNAIGLPAENARPLYEQTIELASRALRQYAKEPPDLATDKHAIIALLQIAVSYARLGELAKAREYSARARKQSPNSVVAITVDGMLNEDAAPVGDAAKLEVARRIVQEERPVAFVPQSSEFIRQVFALN